MRMGTSEGRIPNVMVTGQMEVQAFRRMKADAEWESIQKKLDGVETGWKHTRVVPLIATTSLTASSHVCNDVKARMLDLSSLVPATDDSAAEMVLATLDLNIGPTLPAEDLVGKLPQVRVLSLF